MENLTDDERKMITRVAETLSRAGESAWVDILHQEYGVPKSMIETLVDAYNTLGGEDLLEVVRRATKTDTFYNTYIDGQVITPTEEDKELAELALKKAGLPSMLDTPASLEIISE